MEVPVIAMGWEEWEEWGRLLAAAVAAAVAMSVAMVMSAGRAAVEAVVVAVGVAVGVAAAAFGARGVGGVFVLDYRLCVPTVKEGARRGGQKDAVAAAVELCSLWDCAYNLTRVLALALVAGWVGWVGWRAMG